MSVQVPWHQICCSIWIFLRSLFLKFDFKLIFRHLIPYKKLFFFLAGMGGVTYGFLNSFWTRRRMKVRNRSFFPHKPIIWILDPLSMGGERRYFAPSFLVKNVHSQSRRRDYTFPTSTHSTPTNHPHLEGLLAFTLLVKCQDTLKLLTTNVEKNEA